jgi:RNA recognition motif-containing protein
MNIFVGNLSFHAVEDDVKTVFARFGAVSSVVIVKEKNGIKSRGFGFLEMPDDKEAQTAIGALNGKEFMGRPLIASPARPPIQVKEGRAHKKQLKAEHAEERSRHSPGRRGHENTWFSPVFGKKGRARRHKRGRRSRSYMKEHPSVELEEGTGLVKRKQENPMRWRKKNSQPKHWQKPAVGFQPREKEQNSTQGGQRPRGAHASWRKGPGESSFRKGPANEGRPIRESEVPARPWKRKKPPRKSFRVKSPSHITRYSKRRWK